MTFDHTPPSFWKQALSFGHPALPAGWDFPVCLPKHWHFGVLCLAFPVGSGDRAVSPAFMTGALLSNNLPGSYSYNFNFGFLYCLILQLPIMHFIF